MFSSHQHTLMASNLLICRPVCTSHQWRMQFWDLSIVKQLESFPRGYVCPHLFNLIFFLPQRSVDDAFWLPAL